MGGTRDPFPFPKPENDYTLSGRKQCQKQTFDKPTHLAQNEKPWSRLNDLATLASIRRNVLYHDPQKIKVIPTILYALPTKAPNDSLDFHLKSTYDHHKEFLRSKNETLYQMETVTDDHGRTLKNRGQNEATVCEKDPSVKVWMSSQKSSIYSIEGTIESHHNASTNRGYSRKHDGGFYST
ncbi:protein C1orf194 homolog isoform X1 [Esox lucius]|uniref:protein C1orf194 homolog isoform X1 n=1 Tax=Esox lucius TaxID=8010 RepID=UPI0014776627|nr:protein C1orf194 homolog isoform X1 [Esox lucius]